MNISSGCSQWVWSVSVVEGFACLSLLAVVFTCCCLHVFQLCMFTCFPVVLSQQDNVCCLLQQLRLCRAGVCVCVSNTGPASRTLWGVCV